MHWYLKCKTVVMRFVVLTNECICYDKKRVNMKFYFYELYCPVSPGMKPKFYYFFNLVSPYTSVQLLLSFRVFSFSFNKQKKSFIHMIRSKVWQTQKWEKRTNNVLRYIIPCLAYFTWECESSIYISILYVRTYLL